jgi:hypothetical protein
LPFFGADRSICPAVTAEAYYLSPPRPARRAAPSAGWPDRDRAAPAPSSPALFDFLLLGGRAVAAVPAVSMPQPARAGQPTRSEVFSCLPPISARRPEWPSANASTCPPSNFDPLARRMRAAYGRAERNVSMPGYLAPMMPHSRPACTTCTCRLSPEIPPIDRLADPAAAMPDSAPTRVEALLFRPRPGKRPQADDLVSQRRLPLSSSERTMKLHAPTIRVHIDHAEIIRGFDDARHLPAHPAHAMRRGMQRGQPDGSGRPARARVGLAGGNIEAHPPSSTPQFRLQPAFAISATAVASRPRSPPQGEHHGRMPRAARHCAPCRQSVRTGRGKTRLQFAQHAHQQLDRIAPLLVDIDAGMPAA